MRYPLCPECGSSLTTKGAELCDDCGTVFYRDLDGERADDIRVFAILRDRGPRGLVGVSEALSGLTFDKDEAKERAFVSLRRLMARGYVVSDARGYYALTFAAAQRGRL